PGADEGVGVGMLGEQHFDAAVGAAVQDDEVAVLARLDVHAHRRAAHQRAGGAEPDPYRPGRRSGGGRRYGVLQQQCYERCDHGLGNEARLVVMMITPLAPRESSMLAAAPSLGP